MPHSQSSPDPTVSKSNDAQGVPVLEGVAAALGRIPSGLFLVTWRDSGQDRRMLASWVMQSGFSPPTVTIAIGTTRDLLSAVTSGTPFVINMLAESQRSLLGRLGRPQAEGEDAFPGVEIRRTPSGNAIIDSVAGWLECRAIASLPAHDHTVVVAELPAGDADVETTPLVHVRRNGLRY
jgi:flavin reductase (DIM6/NTAB) family NADH-FMN oxidoreductase RutF